MRRTLVSLCMIFFAVVPVYAQTIPMPTPTPTPAPVEYALPYPGLLPDSPLYKIKAFRDWIVSILIADPLTKASFDVLQADKRLVAAQDLLSETPPNGQLAVETLSKGENYFYKAIEQMKLAKQQGIRVYDITQKLRLSNAKHLEVVRQMEQGTRGSVLQGLQAQEQRIKEFGNIVKKEGAK